MLSTVTLDPDLELLGERIDDRDANAVQTAGDFIRVLVELAAGMEHRHRELDARHLLRRMDVDGNAAPIVLDGDRIVFVNRDRDAVGVADERFIDRVVDDFVNEVVESSLRRRADVHTGAFANGLEPLEDLDLTGIVSRAGLRLISSFRHEIPPRSTSEENPKTAVGPT